MAFGTMPGMLAVRHDDADIGCVHTMLEINLDKTELLFLPGKGSTTTPWYPPLRLLGTWRRFWSRFWVQGLVISHRDYCNSVLTGLPVSAIKPLQLIQNAAARLLNKHKSKISTIRVPPSWPLDGLASSGARVYTVLIEVWSHIIKLQQVEEAVDQEPGAVMMSSLNEQSSLVAMKNTGESSSEPEVQLC
ncbi:unnamed protein product [Pleuronectes platessa]|uniref:Uncharacterized protein n=1 Tax=Pleuronectes platessa TaxID=8262 RepID=A0A9N7Z8X3_PLEPL|nr:unnamed protein product [Pleuronectes platessa]